MISERDCDYGYDKGRRHYKHHKGICFAYWRVETARTFQYDDAGKLIFTSETYNGCGKSTYTYTYGYDAMGNRTEIVKKNIKGRTVDKEKYIYNESNQLQQANLFDGKKWTKVVYTYDQDGNLISEVGRDGCEKVQTYYDYTVENRLEAVYDGKKLLMAAAYDGDGNRVFQLNYDPDAYDDWRYGYGCYKNYRNGCGWDDWYEPDDDRDDRNDRDWGDDRDDRNDRDWGDDRDNRNDRDWDDDRDNNRNDGKNNSANHGNSGKKTASVTGSLRCTTNTIHNSVLYANSGAENHTQNRSEKTDTACDEYTYNSQSRYCIFFPSDKDDDKDKHIVPAQPIQ